MTTKRTHLGDFRWPGIGMGATLGLILAAYVASRGLLLERTLYGPAMPGLLIGSDVGAYEVWSSEVSGGELTQNPGWQYPPLALVLFYSLSLVPGDYFRVFVLAALVADAIILTSLIAPAIFRRCSPLGALLWALGGFIISPMILVRFDIFPAMFLVLSLAFGYRTYLTPILLGLGAALKVWPVVGLISSPPKSMIKAVAVFVVAFATSVLIVGLNVGNVWQFVANSAGRGLQVEAPISSFIYLYSLFDPTTINQELRFGSLEITGSTAEALATGVTFTFLVIALLLVTLRFAGPLRSALPSDVTFLAVSLFILFSKVGSPQFAIWLLAAAALASSYPDSQLRGPIALGSIYIAITGLSFADGIGGYGLLIEGAPQVVLLHLLRTLILLVAVIWAFRELLTMKHLKELSV